jgi:hypothetical protein
VRHRIDGHMRPGLWLGRDFPMRRFSRQDIPLQSQVFDTKGRTRLRHNRRPNIDLPTHAKHCHIWGRQLSHSHTSSLAPAASAVAPPALIFPVRLPANRYVNTTAYLNRPYTAHHKLTPHKDGTTSELPTLSYVRLFFPDRCGRPLASNTLLCSPTLTTHHGRTERRTLPNRRPH